LLHKLKYSTFIAALPEKNFWFGISVLGDPHKNFYCQGFNGTSNNLMDKPSHFDNII